MPNLVAEYFGKPEIVVRPNSNTRWSSAGCWKRELADRAGQSDAPDLAFLVVVGCIFGKPDGIVRPCRDAIHVAEGVGYGKFADRAGWCDTPDLVVPAVKVCFLEPEVAIWPGNDIERKKAFGEREQAD